RWGRRHRPLQYCWQLVHQVNAWRYPMPAYSSTSHQWAATAVQPPICRFTQTNCFASVPGWKQLWPATPTAQRTKFAKILIGTNSSRLQEPKNTVWLTRYWNLAKKTLSNMSL